MKFKYSISVGFIALASIVFLAMMSPKGDQLTIGDSVPKAELKLENIDNVNYSLKEVAGENGLLVIFSCNTCPFVIGNGSKSEGWQNRYPGIGELCNELGVELVLINSNEAKRKKGDSIEDMKRQYKTQNYSGYYLVDQNSILADAFGAQTTPHVYLFDATLKLVYTGAIDDNVNRKDEVDEHYLNDALNNMTKGKKIDPETTRNIGCSIKRV